MSLRLSDAHDGDVVKIGEVEYRLMIKGRSGYLCRYRDEPEDEWSDGHTWLTDGTEIDSVVLEQPRRVKGNRGLSIDPMDREMDGANDSFNWRGTIK